jgi:hypothetical protein
MRLTINNQLIDADAGLSILDVGQEDLVQSRPPSGSPSKSGA